MKNNLKQKPRSVRLSGCALAALMAVALAGCGGGDTEIPDPKSDDSQKRFTPTAALFKDQWHLSNTGQKAPALSGTSGVDLKVLPVWEQKDDRGRDLDGSGIKIGVVDSGLQIKHPNLNIAPGLSHNYVDDTDDPTPTDPQKKHGTRVAGVIAAKNGMRVIGVAPGAQLAGFNLLAHQNAFNVHDALSRGVSDGRIDISNNSWSVKKGTVSGIPFMQVLRDAVLDGVNQGRHGKGILYIFSGGNSRHGEDSEYVNVRQSYDWANFHAAREPAIFTICAIDARGRSAPYSNYGSNLLVCAPSSGNATVPRITTTDLNSEYTHEFGGTSAATAMVSGVVALMLQANPDLTWRDIRLILARTARFTDGMAMDPESGFIQAPNPAMNPYTNEPYRYSVKYGFGLVKAAKAVAYAKKFKSNPDRYPSVGGSTDAWWNNEDNIKRVNPAKAIEITKKEYTEIALPMSFSFNKKVEFTEIEVGVQHSRFRDLEMLLISPSGTVIPLTVVYPYCGTGAKDPFQNNTCPTSDFGDLYRTSVTAALDEPANGDWLLRVRDFGRGATGKIKSVKLTIH